MSEHPTNRDDQSDETLESGPRDGDGSSATPPVPTETYEHTPSPSPSGVPQRIGQYRIKRAIASGGMGTVYEALQEKPRRTVAVKLMRAGIASRSALRRFEYESQLLARLRHNGIAQVYDAGTHKDGEVTVPYFAMEYIVGAKPITDYAREKKLGTRERIKLFIDVCQAVHHGHQKGIIHRDLKPSNVLVDSSGQVKIIDFGVARSTDSDMAVTTLQTDVGQLLGTLQYMSPEQCAADPHDIDTRSDVYALGVILYEVLCERLPYDLKGTAIHEATRVIREQQPPRLSTLNKALRGDVETIALKALEKDRDRRYQSASALTADLKRYLNNEAIAARPPSVIYQLRVFARRNKGFAAAVVAVVLVLTAGLILSDLQRRRALRAETLAQRRLEDAETARDEAEAVTKFLTDTLASVDPEKQGKDVSVREVLDAAAEKIGKTFADRPLVEARLQKTVGWTYRSLGLFDRAEHHLAEAAALYREKLGAGDPKTLGAMTTLATVIADLGDYSNAVASEKAALEIQRRVLGEENPSTLSTMSNLAAHLGNQGRFAEAEALDRKTLEIRRRILGEKHRDTLGSMNSLATVLHDQGRYAEAEALERETLEIQRRVLGEEQPDTLMSMNNLAINLMGQGKYAEAEALQRKMLEISRRVMGEEHPMTAGSMQNLALDLRHLGRDAEAEVLYRKALEIRRRVQGEEHPEALKCMDGLAYILSGEGRYAEAEALHRKTLEISRRVFGNDNGGTVIYMNNLADSLDPQGRYAEAEQLYREALKGFGRVLGEEHPFTLECMSNLGRCLDHQGRYAEAEERLRKALEIQRRVRGEEHPDTLDSAALLACCLGDQGKLAEAEELFRTTIKTDRRIRGKGHPSLGYPLTGLAEVLIKKGEPKEAQSLVEEALAIRQAAHLDDTIEAADTKSALGESLTALGQFDKAEPLLLNSYDKLKAVQGESGYGCLKAMKRIVKLYEAWHAAEPDKGYDAKAAEWRAKLPKEKGKKEAAGGN